jgi:hypothetical protein
MRASKIWFVVAIIGIVFLCKCQNNEPQYLDLDTTKEQNILWNMQNLKVGDTLKLEYRLKTCSDGKKMVYLDNSFYSPDTSILKVEPWDDTFILQGELLEMISPKDLFRVRLIERNKHKIRLMSTGFEIGDTLDVWLDFYGRKIKKTTRTNVPNKGS